MVTISSIDTKYNYMLLDRLTQDSKEYIKSFGKTNLWGKTIQEHIECMKILYNQMEVKPEWLTLEQINLMAEIMKLIEDIKK